MHCVHVLAVASTPFEPAQRELTLYALLKQLILGEIWVDLNQQWLSETVSTSSIEIMIVTVQQMIKT